MASHLALSTLSKGELRVVTYVTLQADEFVVCSLQRALAVTAWLLLVTRKLFDIQQTPFRHDIRCTSVTVDPRVRPSERNHSCVHHCDDAHCDRVKFRLKLLRARATRFSQLDTHPSCVPFTHDE